MIFGERPLGKVLIALLCGFSLFSAFSLSIKLALCALGGFLFLLTLLPKLREKAKGLRLPLLFLMGGILLSLCYFDLYYPASRSFTGEQTITATVTDADDTLSYKRTFTLKTSEVGGRKCRYRFKADLYYGTDDLTDGSFSLSDIRIGDTLLFFGTVETFGKSKSGFDFDNYYLSRGICAEADVKTILARTEAEGKRESLSYRFKQYRLSLCRIIEERAGKDAGGFLSAVLLGEREKMSDSMRMDFERIGISHLLALSGMHLAILTGILSKLLSLFHIGKKGRYICLILFSAFFTALTGFSSSVVRSAIMISIGCLLFLLGYSHDALTSLAIAVTVILLFEPYAARSVGLWLSAFSCFGIIFGSRLIAKDSKDREEKNAEKKQNGMKTPGRLSKAVLAIRNSLLISVFAILATAIFQTSAFGRTSLLSAISTPAFSLLLEGFLFLGTFLLAFGKWIPVGKPLRYFYYLIRSLCETLSDLRGIQVNSSCALCLIIGGITLLTFLCFLFVRIRKPGRAILIFSILVIAFYGTAFLNTELRKNREIVVYRENGSNEYLLISTTGKTTAVDLSDADTASAYDFSAIINTEHLAEIDVYICSGYSSSMAGSLRTLLTKVMVRKIVLPKPKSEEEKTIYHNLLTVLADFRCKIDLYEERESLGIGEYSLIEIYRESSDIGKKKILTLLDEENIYTYFSAGILEEDTKTVAEPLIKASDTLIFGCHGTKYEYMHKLNETLPALKHLVISDKNIVLGENLIGTCDVHYSPIRYVVKRKR